MRDKLKIVSYFTLQTKTSQICYICCNDLSYLMIGNSGSMNFLFALLFIWDFQKSARQKEKNAESIWKCGPSVHMLWKVCFSAVTVRKVEQKCLKQKLKTTWRRQQQKRSSLNHTVSMARGGCSLSGASSKSWLSSSLHCHDDCRQHTWSSSTMQ